MKKYLFLLLSIFCLVSCTTVDSGSIGIRFKKFSTNNASYGGVEGTCKGWVIYNPFTEKIFTYPIFVQRKDYEPFTVTAKDASTFHMDPVIAYRIDPDKACDIFVKYRKKVEDLESGYIKTCIQEAYRVCCNMYTSDSLMSHRADFEQDVRSRLSKSLGEEGFIVEEFTSQIEPPASLAKTIDEKNQAVQQGLKAQNEVKRAEAEAQIAIAKAKGKAEALRIEADGEAYYNRTIAASLTDNLIKQDFIEKWNGEVPTVMGSTATIMDISKTNN